MYDLISPSSELIFFLSLNMTSVISLIRLLLNARLLKIISSFSTNLKFKHN